MTETEFTPSWRRPIRKNDVVPSSAADNGTAGKPLWHRYPCIVCGKPPPTGCTRTPSTRRENEDSPTSAPTSAPMSSTAPPSHKRCSRCRSVVYCSSECQKRDYVQGKHKGGCASLGKLWEEKSSLEKRMWENKNGSTNPFDDEVYDYPIVGKFWHDQPSSSLEKTTTRYCVVLLQLVQLLGRGESWRMATSRAVRRREGNEDGSTGIRGGNEEEKCRFGRRGPGNPLSRELAIDLAYRLYHLDRTDLRVRLLIPSLLLEGGYYRESYDFLKHWLRADGSLMIMDLAMMGGPGGGMGASEEASSAADDNPFDISSGGDVTEKPELWMDGEMVYPSIGMVFELAFLKCHLLCSLRSDRWRTTETVHSRDDGPRVAAAFGAEEEAGTEPVSLAEECAAAGEDELDRQVRVLLSLVHKWNSHLLPELGERYDVNTGASAIDENDASSMADEGFAVLPATPPAVSTLLNKHPPGFELQYKMGNPGGQTLDEAVSIWQRDMILWHHVDPRAMKLLSEFCSDLENNVVDTSCLNGGGDGSNRDLSSVGSASGSGARNAATEADNAENVAKRKEAEELVLKLQQEKPGRTMGEIMMHPEMAQLMVKHLHTE